MKGPTGEGYEAPASSDRPRLSLTRVLAAPIERVWQAWISPGEMVRWLGPVDYPASHMEADVRVGGAWRACLSARLGTDVLWQSGRYLTVNPPKLLRFTFRWESANHEAAGIETVVTVSLDQIDAGSTQLTLVQDGLASDQSVDGHGLGWSSTFDRLSIYLRTQGASRSCN